MNQLWIKIFSRALLFLFVFLFSINTKAAVSVTAPSLSVTGCGVWPTNSFPLGNIIITEGAVGDISTSGTIVITAPSNFEFTNAGAVSFNVGDLASATSVLTSSTVITITLTLEGGNGTNEADIITISGIMVRGTTTATGPSNVTRTGGTCTISGMGVGTVVATLTSYGATNKPSAADQYRCGTGSVNLTASGGSSTYFWYDEPTLGTLVGTSSTYATPSLSSSRPYYVTDGVLGSETSLSTGAVDITCVSAVVKSAQLFDISNTSSNTVIVTKLSASTLYLSGSTNVQIYYRSDSYTGNETSSSGWTSIFSGSVTRGTNPQLIDVADFTIPSGSVAGIYIYFEADPSAFTTGSGVYSNSDITVSGGAIECQISSPFTLGSGSLFSGYTFSGSVYYKSILCETAREEAWALINSTSTPSVSITSNTGTIICAGTNVTFTATNMNGGVSPVYQWKINGSNVGANSPNYSTTTLANGDIVTCVLTPSGEMCPSPATATSNSITMSVLSPTTINSSPSNTTLCQNGNTSFTCSSTPAGPYQWQLSTDGGATWVNITAAGSTPTYGGWTTGTLTLNGADDPNNGYKYRCMAGCTPSNVATLTINPVSDPVAVNNGSCSSPASVTISATGAGAGEDYNWYNAVTGGSLLQSGGSSYTTPPIAVTTTYYVTKFNTVFPFCESYPRTPVQAIIYTAPTITSQPVNDNTNVNGSATFSVVASGMSLSYQWQVSTNAGATWNNITTAGSNPTYSGWNNSTLNLTGVAASNNNYQYRCIVTGICSLSTTSTAGTLTVNTSLTYLHPTTGLQSTYVGACMEATCSGTYYDDGGASSPYSTNINNIYRTFCPNTALKAVTATVTSMDIAFSGGNCNDILYVLNGPTQASPILWSGCGTTPTIYTSSGAYSGGVFTSTHQSGCLTFVFTSGSVNTGTPPPWDGWNITLSCSNYAGGPSGTANTDCINSTPICSDISASSFTYGPGITSDVCPSASCCVTSENFTEWYRIKIATSGTIQLEIVPNGVSDLDFAFFRASNCGSLGDPIRCSYAARTSPGKTGMRDAAGTLDFSEDVSGDQWVQEVNVTAGETYFLMINEWNKPNPNQYTLDWTLTNGASFDCSILLPVSMLDFYAYKNDNVVDVNWVTTEEINNDYFTIERSADCVNFEEIGTIKGAGNSSSVNSYSFTDFNPLSGTGYYRLKQTDYDGKFVYTHTIAVTFEHEQITHVELFPNPSSGYIKIVTDRYLIDETYEIVDLFGSVVLKGILNGNSSVLYINSLSNGVYFFRIKGSDVKKFVIIKD